VPLKLDRQAMALCQALHTAVRGNPNRWTALSVVCITAGIGEDEADAVARHAAGLGWLVLNTGPVLHSIALGPKLWEALR
jgi:hypothetical protein